MSDSPNESERSQTARRRQFRLSSLFYVILQLSCLFAVMQWWKVDAVSIGVTIGVAFPVTFVGFWLHYRYRPKGIVRRVGFMVCVGIILLITIAVIFIAVVFIAASVSRPA